MVNIILMSAMLDHSPINGTDPETIGLYTNQKAHLVGLFERKTQQMRSHLLQDSPILVMIN